MTTNVRSKRNKYVYIIMAHNPMYNSTYISRVCSNKKKAAEEQRYIESVMRGEPNVYWTIRERVS
jgi:hypothetical protein